MPNVLGQVSSWNLYHYTDINALINIVNDNGIVLWATNCSYLNDPKELQEGINAVKRIEGVSIHPGSLRNYYLTSFSSNSDSLNMWGMYAANGLGCAIGFDYDMLWKGYGIMIQCSYGEAEVDTRLKGSLNLARNGCMAHISPEGNMSIPKFDDKTDRENREALVNNSIICACLGAKNEAYRSEAETRGIVYVNEGKYVKFRSRKGYIVPYVQIILPKDALKEIIVGPTTDSELTMKSILQMLSLKGYDIDNIKISKSKIPYRG